MYSAEQIRNKAYIPDPNYRKFNENAVIILIMLADSAHKKMIQIRQEHMYDFVPQMLRFEGYNVEPVEFLGTKFWQISW